MAASPERSKPTSDQEHQQAKEEENLEDSSKVPETKLSPPRPDDPSLVSHDSVSQEADVPVSQEAKPVLATPRQEPGEELESIPESPLEDVDVWEESFIRVQLPISSKMRRLLSAEIQERDNPIGNTHQKQKSPTPGAQEIHREGKYRHCKTRKPRVITHRGTRSSACLYCGRLRPHLCFFTKMMSRVKALERRLQNHAVQHNSKRNFRSHLGVGERRKHTLAGNQTQRMSSSLIHSLEQSPHLKGCLQLASYKEGLEEHPYILAYESKDLKGPFHCPCCSCVCDVATKFVSHLRRHSGIKVTVMLGKPSLFMCPYCQDTNEILETILAHKCPKL